MAFPSSDAPRLTANWTIICDFDGTATPFDVTDALLDAFAPPEWEDVERQWLDGRLTARQCMERQVRLLDVSISKLNAFLDDIPLTGGFADFAALCRRQGLALRIVSDGIDHAIKRILKRHGLGELPVISN